MKLTPLSMTIHSSPWASRPCMLKLREKSGTKRVRTNATKSLLRILNVTQRKNVDGAPIEGKFGLPAYPKKNLAAPMMIRTTPATLNRSGRFDGPERERPTDISRRVLSSVPTKPSSL